MANVPFGMMRPQRHDNIALPSQGASSIMAAAAAHDKIYMFNKEY
jgi:hypothetical protein